MKIQVAGRAVYLADGGRPFEPDRPAVILLHGAGMDHSVWSLPARWLAHHGHAVCAPDFPGHGRSDGPPVATVAELAEWSMAVLSELGAGPARVAGHSMGALVALECARRWPGRVGALALFGAALEMPVHPGLLQAAAERPTAAAAMMTEWGHAAAARLGGGRNPGMWMTGGARRLLARAPAGTLHAALALCNEYAEGLDAAAGVSVPTRVVSGSDDRMTPARAGRKLSHAITGAVFEEIPDCGHMMMTEAPEQTLRALRAAFASQP